MDGMRIITHSANPTQWQLVAPCPYTGRDRTLEEGSLAKCIARRRELEAQS